MRTAIIQPHFLRGLTDLEPAESWIVRLSQAGLLRPEAEFAPDSPQADMDRIYRGTLALCDLEEEIMRTRYSAQRFYQAPWFSFVVLIGIYLLSLLWAAQTEDFIDRLLRFAWVWVVLALAASGVMVVMKGAAAGRETARELSHRKAKALAAETRDEILSVRDTFLTRSFAAVVKHRLLILTPHLDWLERGLREVPVESKDLRDRFLAAQAQIQDTVERYRKDPPEHWTEDGLTADIAGLAAAMEAEGLARIPPLPQLTR